MNFDQKTPPRQFEVGNSIRFNMKDCGNVYLDENEQVTFVTENGAQYDVAKKNWGFYATPSLNGRLVEFGLKTMLIKNTLTGRYFIFLLEKGKEWELENYLKQESLEVVASLSTTEELDAVAEVLKVRQ
tara:strand:+ start:834 stop:1220 length:387 start_codon:yes stop_codon:yes gene_type:complete